MNIPNRAYGKEKVYGSIPEGGSKSQVKGMIVDHAWRRGTDRGTTCASVDSAQWSRTVTANSGGWPCARSVPGSTTAPNAEYGVPEGAGLRNLGSRRMASFGDSWNCLLEAAGAFVVALAARRSWFCYHRLVAVLRRFGRRRTGLAEKGRAGPGRCLGRALVGPGARGRSASCWPRVRPGRVGREAAGG